MIYDYDYAEPFLVRQIITYSSGYQENKQVDTLNLNRRKQRTFINYFQQYIKKRPIQEAYCAASSDRYASLLWIEKRKEAEHYYEDSFYPCITDKMPFPEIFLETFYFLETFFKQYPALYKPTE